jgi:hypothetical protein
LLLQKYSLQGKHLNEFIATVFGRRIGKKAKGMSSRPPKQMFRECFMRDRRESLDAECRQRTARKDEFAESYRAHISKITK